MENTSDSVIIEPMNEQQAETAWLLAAQEGWNPGLDDHRILPLIDPEGCVAISVKHSSGGKTMAGCMCVVDWGGYGFIGMYIVKKEFRGKSLGRKLLHHFAPKLKTLQNTGLDGVEQKVRKYRTFGFHIAYSIGRYLIPPDRFDDRGTAKPLTHHDVDAAADYDREIFGVDRRAFLKNWISSRHADAAILKTRGKVIGFGVVRTCRQGRKIGPLFAENHTAARDIIGRLVSFQPGSEHYIDVPSLVPGREQIISGLEQKFICTRMYMNETPAQDVTRVFGNTTFEMG